MGAITLPVLLVTTVGLGLGLILSLAAKFIAVEADETVAKVRELLPGANCGACGYAGCDEYAEKVASGEAATNLCIPGRKKVADEIAALLGKDAADVTEPRAFVRCNGKCDTVEYAMEYQGPKSCKACSALFGGDKSCSTACLGYGDCAAVCQFDAIVIQDGLAYIDARLCTGCGACVKECPKNVISMVPKTSKVTVACSNHQKGAETRKVCKSGCIGCMRCEKTCRYDAIKVVDNLAVIDPERCTNCGECAGVCPTKCILVSA